MMLTMPSIVVWYGRCNVSTSDKRNHQVTTNMEVGYWLTLIVQSLIYHQFLVKIYQHPHKQQPGWVEALNV